MEDIKKELEVLENNEQELNEVELKEVSGGNAFFLYGQPGIEVPVLPGYLP